VTPEDRRRLRIEILVVLSVFPLPALVTAVVVLLRSAVEGVNRSPIVQLLPHHPLLSSIVGAVQYATALPVVLVVWYLLTSSGQSFRDLGVTRDGLGRDLLAGVALVLAGLGLLLVTGLVVYAIFGSGGAPGSYAGGVGHLPAVYLIQALTISVVTATVEETVINAYLLTRLAQLGWSPRKALWVSLALRTSYHAYYGVGLLFTIPIGYLLTRSFQRNSRVQRCIAAHFLYDALLFTLAILNS
jgi:membrane protease YdiL (CAAX protease family)